MTPPFVTLRSPADRRGRSGKASDQRGELPSAPQVLDARVGAGIEQRLAPAARPANAERRGAVDANGKDLRMLAETVALNHEPVAGRAQIGGRFVEAFRPVVAMPASPPQVRPRASATAA